MLGTHIITEKDINWIIEKHSRTNHFYDKYLPYEFHLRMVVQTAKNYEYILKGTTGFEKRNIFLACWGHDLIEDTRTSYNEIKDKFNEEVAELIYALTNEKGRNRAERGNQKYYDGIKKIPYADFIKMCDRIANVQYSKMTKSSMFKKYKTEHASFIAKISDVEIFHHYLQDMFVELNDLIYK